MIRFFRALLAVCFLAGCSSPELSKEAADETQLRDLSQDYVAWWIEHQPVPDAVLLEADNHWERLTNRDGIRENAFLVAFAQGYLDGILDPTSGAAGTKRGYFAGRQVALKKHPLTEARRTAELAGFGYDLVEVEGRYLSSVSESRFRPIDRDGENWWLDSIPGVLDRSQIWRGRRAVFVRGYLSPPSARQRNGYSREIIAVELRPTR